MATKIQLRRGTAAEWTAGNPTLASGEVGVETDTRFQKVGDGTTAWASLPYAIVKDASSATVTATGSTTARTLAARHADAVNVKDFGALGDGVADDTAAIQAAITAVTAAGGGTIHVPRGTYLVTGLTLGSNVEIRGQGYGTLIKRKNGAVTPTPVIYASSKTGIALRHLRVDGNKANLDAGAPRSVGQPWENISLAECTNAVVERVWSDNADNEGVDIDGGSNILVAWCTVTGCGGAAVHPSNGTGALVNEGVRVHNLVSSGNGATYQRGAVQILDGKFTVVDGVRSAGDYYGVHVSTGSASWDARVAVRNVEVQNSTAEGVLIYNGTRMVTLDSIEIIGSGAAGLYVAAAADDRASRWTRVRVVNPTGVGIRIAGSNWTLTDAEVVNPTGPSIQVEAAGGDGMIVRPRLSGGASATRGIQIASPRITVIAPDISGHTAEGIYTDNVADVQVIGGRSTGGTYGYYMNNSGGSLRHRVVGCSFTGNSSAGLRAVGSGHTFVGCPGVPTVSGGVSADRGDASATLNAGTDEELQRWATALTTHRTVTLGTPTGIQAGSTFKVVRSGGDTGGPWNLSVGSGPLKALAAGTWCEVTYTGSAWVLTGYGAL